MTMAEIRVEPKRRSMTWLWLLLLVAVAAAVAWYFMNNGRNELPPAGSTAPAGSAAPAPSPAVAQIGAPPTAARITS
jgi:hypothetical protein